MKHYTSTELVSKMGRIGYYFDKFNSYKGNIVFLTSDDGVSAFPTTFSTWKDVAFFVHDWIPFHR
jgi:hypothetical protein